MTRTSSEKSLHPAAPVAARLTPPTCAPAPAAGIRGRAAKAALTIVAVLLGLHAHGFSIEVVKNENASLEVYGRGQMIGVIESVDDPTRDDNRLYLFMKQSRLGFKGNYDTVKYDTQLAFGGEDTQGSNTGLTLLDFVADVPVGNNAWFKIGQFRVPYSREGLTDRGFMNFGDRSIANLGSYQTRDYGLALLDTGGLWHGTIGVFSAGGRDIPQRYLPERLGVPEIVGRFGYNDGVDEDIYHVVQTDLNLKRTTKAAYFNALYMKDTLIGHSSVLQSRTIDKNLLIDTGFNPYINQGGGPGLGTIAGTKTMQRGSLWFVGGDAVVRRFLAPGRALEGEVEVNWGRYRNRFGSVQLSNFRVQGDYQFQPFELGLRYALLNMDSKSGFLSNSATGTGATAGTPVKQVVNNQLGDSIHEITPSFTYHFKEHNLKLVTDLPIYLNCPIWYDKMGNATPLGSQPVGGYAFPDPTSTTQNSLLATPGNSTARKTVVELRMLFQFMF